MEGSPLPAEFGQEIKMVTGESGIQVKPVAMITSYTRQVYFPIRGISAAHIL